MFTVVGVVAAGFKVVIKISPANRQDHQQNGLHCAIQCIWLQNALCGYTCRDVIHRYRQRCVKHTHVTCCGSAAMKLYLEVKMYLSMRRHIHRIACWFELLSSIAHAHELFLLWVVIKY